MEIRKYVELNYTQNITMYAVKIVLRGLNKYIRRKKGWK